MKFSRNKIAGAILATLGGLGAVQTSQAVHINPDGLGQVLIYPYYSARTDKDGNPYQTLISITNSTNTAKAVKIRFIEGINSNEVLDFNLFLSENDMWTATISATATGAKISTTDNSCTAPTLPDTEEVNGVTIRSKEFVNFRYAGTAADSFDPSLDRTREGYIEIIEMADIINTSALGVAVTHGNNGVPTSCTYVQPTNNPAGDVARLVADMLGGTGGLEGTASILNAGNGADYSYDATALDNFNRLINFTTPDNILPNLSSTFDINTGNKTSNRFSGTGIITSNWINSPIGSIRGSTFDAVSALLMHDSVINEYVLDSAFDGTTDWVITMPTKREYVNVGTGLPIRPFSQRFNTEGACEAVSIVAYNREEQVRTVVADFSPAPPPSQGQSLCYETNVISYGSKSPFPDGSTRGLLGSKLGPVIPVDFQHGWSRITFIGANAVNGSMIDDDNTWAYRGLPVVGFMAQSFQNLATNTSFGGLFNHKLSTNIQRP